MKHVFECDIVGESNDEVGDTLLAGMMGIALPPTKDRKLPDDFTLEIPDRDLMLGTFSDGQNLWAKYEAICAGMVERGYKWIKWRDEERHCYMLRFRRVSKQPH